MVIAWNTRDEGADFLPASSGKPEGLLVIFHGFCAKRCGSLWKMAEVLHAALPDVDIVIPQLDIRRWNSGVAPEDMAAAAIRTIDSVCAGKNYTDIRFVAHSLGAPFARKVLIGAYGPKSPEVPLETAFVVPAGPQRNWHQKVSRIVFIGGLTRGWMVNERQKLWQRFAGNFFGLFGHVMSLLKIRSKQWGYLPAIFKLRRGAPFIVNTRLQWLALTRASGPDKPDPVIVHLMASEDNQVSPVEVIDIETSQTAGRIFSMLVPDSDHHSILDIAAQEKRRKCLFSALLAAVGKNRAVCPFHQPNQPDLPPLNASELTIPMSFMDDNITLNANMNVNLLTFVIHGIRDNGYWTKKIGATIRESFAEAVRRLQRKNEPVVATDTQTYGYFTAFPFIFPWIRQAKVEWLMDRYATARALNPVAEFSYVGHSNGTYLAARALQDYDTCRFARIVFAGSVVRCDYKWKKLIAQQRVGAVINYVATGDIVVALLTKGLRPLGLDVGSASHDGFTELGENENMRFVIGGHGAGVGEPVWRQIADFIVNGTPPTIQPRDQKYFSDHQNLAVKAIGKISTLVLLVFALLIADGAWSLLVPLLNIPVPASLHAALAELLGWPHAFDSWWWLTDLGCAYDWLPKWLQAVMAVGYFWLLHFFLFRF